MVCRREGNSSQGVNGFLSALPNNRDATVDSMTWNGDYGSAYAAVMTLHEITTGGLGAIIDELEAGNTVAGAIMNAKMGQYAEIPTTCC
jgi:flagellin